MEVLWLGSDSYPQMYCFEQRDQLFPSQEAEQPPYSVFPILVVWEWCAKAFFC